MHSLVEKVKEARVVGTGGAGFPTHVQYGTPVGIVVANGADNAGIQVQIIQFHRQGQPHSSTVNGPE